MKQKFISIFILILLSACSSISPAPTAATLAASINTPLPTEPPTSAPTQTPAPTENPALEYQKIEEEYIATLSSEQKALYGQYNSKDRTAEGLTRRFLDGDLSTYLAYVDTNKNSKDFGEVTSVWNPEQQKPNPALLIENNLFINENSASQIIWNPELNRTEAKQTMADYMKYVRLKLVAEANGIELSNTLEGALANEEVQKLVAQGDSLTLNRTWRDRGENQYNVSAQDIHLSSSTSIIFKIVGSPDEKMTKIRTRISGDYFGWSFNQSKVGPLEIRYFNKGLDDLTGNKNYEDYIFARRMTYALQGAFTRAERVLQETGDVDVVTSQIIFNSENYSNLPDALIIFSKTR